MANALKKIQARVKKLRKRYPKKKYSSLMKQAGREYKAGKLKTRKKSAAPKKRKAPRRKPATKRKSVARKRRRVGSKRPVVVRRRTVVVYKSRKRRARVSGVGASMKKILPVVAVAALGVGAYMMLKPKTPVIVQTSNPTRNTLASDIVSYAQAASMTAAAVANLINTINKSNDAQVQKIYDNIKAGRDPMANVAGVGNTGRVLTMM